MAASSAEFATASKDASSDRRHDDQVTFDVHASAHLPFAPLVPLRLEAHLQPAATVVTAPRGSGPVAKIEDVTAQGKLVNSAASIVVVEENTSQHMIASGTQCTRACSISIEFYQFYYI